MRRSTRMFAAAACAMLLAGCQPDSQDGQVLPHVTVRSLDPGDFAARFEISVQAQPTVPLSAHAVALLTAGSEACVDRTFDMDWSGFDSGNDDAPPAKGQRLAMVMSCRHDRVPNHRVLEADEPVRFHAVPADTLTLTGSARYRDDETAMRASDRVTGELVRRAYTDRCDGRSVVVELLEFRTQPNDARDSPSTGKSMFGTLQFRCGDRHGEIVGDPSARP